jgi:hypothetical protein
MSKSKAAIDAMLRHLAGDHDPQDFPSTAYERHALIEAAGKRGLIAWQKDRRRYMLTPAGWRRLRRGRGLGLASLAISAGAGAAIGAAALAVLWLPGEVSPRSIAEPAASASRVDTARALVPAPPPPLAVAPVAAVAGEGAPNVMPAHPVEPPTAAEQSAPKQTDAEAAPAGAKPPAARKSRHRTASAHRRRAWDAARSYRDERFAGTGRTLR